MNEIKVTKEKLEAFLSVVEKYGKPVVILPIVILGLKGINDIKDLAKEAIITGVPFDASFMGLSIKLNQSTAVES